MNHAQNAPLNAQVSLAAVPESLLSDRILNKLYEELAKADCAINDLVSVRERYFTGAEPGANGASGQAMPDTVEARAMAALSGLSARLDSLQSLASELNSRL